MAAMRELERLGATGRAAVRRRQRRYVMTVGLVAQRGEPALTEEARDGGGASGVAVTAGALSRRAKANARPKICETGKRAGSAAYNCEECSGSKA